MSAEVLRRAVDGIRADHQSWHMEKEACGHPDCEHNAFMNAVADWLEESADHLEDMSGFPREHVCPTALEGLECSVLGQALTVARAYLGEQP